MKLIKIPHAFKLGNFEASLRNGKMAAREMQGAKQAIRDGFAHGGITISRLDAIVDRPY